MHGYSGRILKIDLTSRQVESEKIDSELARKFIGSAGINARLAYDLIKPGIDPLSPDNVILIGRGPLCGTRLTAPKCTVVTKFPLSGAIAFASGGMGLGTRLMRAGYDHLLISGRADRPVYLRIFNDEVEIGDASLTHTAHRPPKSFIHQNLSVTLP